MTELVRKALHTFWQAFLPVFIGGLWNIGHVYGTTGISGVKSTAIALIVAAIAAGLSAAKTLVVSQSSTSTSTPTSTPQPTPSA
jgi:hypothetical protein